MDEEKIYPPTQRKLRKLKESGEGVRSLALVSACGLLGGVLSIWGLFPLLAARFKQMMTQGLSLRATDAGEAFYSLFSPLIFPLLLIGGCIWGATVLAYLAQGGWSWHWKPKTTFFRFQEHRLGRFVLMLLKIVVIVLGVYFAKHLFFTSAKVLYVPRMTLFVALVLTLGFIVVGVVERFYEHWLFMKKHKMSKQEIEDERKEVEGDAQTKTAMRTMRGNNDKRG